MTYDRSEPGYIDAVIHIGEEVDSLLHTSGEGISLFDFHSHLFENADLEKRRQEYISRFLRRGKELLDDAGKFRLLTSATSIHASPEAPDELMSDLAGNWLALYYMAVPFPHLWEPVMFFSEGSGFPRGPGLCKAVGDIYRNSRIAYARCPQGDIEAVYILDHNPLALPSIRDSLKSAMAPGVDPRKRLGAANALLGALYELLQLRLYLHAGAPVKLMVPRSSLFDAFTSRSKKRKEHARDAGLFEDITYLWKSVELSFPKSFADEQSVYIADGDEQLNAMPGCVLSCDLGVIRPRDRNSTLPGYQVTDGRQGNIVTTVSMINLGRAGNYLPRRLLDTYRGKLKEEQINERGLQEDGELNFRNRCREMMGVSDRSGR